MLRRMTASKLSVLQTVLQRADGRLQRVCYASLGSWRRWRSAAGVLRGQIGIRIVYRADPDFLYLSPIYLSSSPIFAFAFVFGLRSSILHGAAAISPHTTYREQAARSPKHRYAHRLQSLPPSSRGEDATRARK